MKRLRIDYEEIKERENTMFNAINKKIFINIFSILFLFNFLLADPTDGCELAENEIFLTASGDVIYNIP